MNVRNFCIIAHIDHGKSTLADRFLELTHTVEMREMKEQLLDSMDIERERGITIKLQPATMQYKNHTLNLIDTPGHVDFQYEVGRSLAAVEGALLLVDATQGIQAQTLSTLYAALEQDLTIIPVVNKVDLPAAQTELVTKELAKLLGIAEDRVLHISAKTGQGVTELLDRIIESVPEPKGDPAANLSLLVFDSLYDSYRGVIAFVRVVDGEIKSKDELVALASKCHTQASEIGILTPGRTPQDKLATGSIGYIVSTLKDITKIRVGETLAHTFDTKALPGYKVVQPRVYSSIFPIERSEINQLREALGELSLNDAALTYAPENNPMLGSGFRCGFLGALHLEIVRERLAREGEVEIITTTPTVAHQIKTTDGQERMIETAADFPDPTKIVETKEPITTVEVVCRSQDIGTVLDLIHKHRGHHKNTSYLDEERVVVTGVMPLSEIIVTFHDELKSATAGYGSFSYEPAGLQIEPVVKMDVLIAGEPIPALSQVVPKSKVDEKGRNLVAKLKTLVPKQNFATPIQATVNGKVIARETVAALRKDVTAKLYGGDITRKRKLLEKQKKGKKRMAQFGSVNLPPDIFIDILKQD